MYTNFLINYLKIFLIKIYLNYFSYYDIPVDDVRKLINAIDNRKTEFQVPPFTPFISKRLRDLVGIQSTDENKLIKELQINNKKIDELKQQTNNELRQTKVELTQVKDEL